MDFNKKQDYAVNWLEQLYGKGPYSLERNIQSTKDWAHIFLIRDYTMKLGEEAGRQHPEAKMIIEKEINDIREKVSNAWENNNFTVNDGGEVISVSLPHDLGKLIHRYWSFIQTQPDLLDTLKDPKKYKAEDVGEIIMRLPSEDPNVRRFQFSCMKYGFQSKIVSEIIDTPTFGRSPHLGRFISNGNQSMEERKKTGNITVLYTNGVENISQAFLERFGQKRKREDGGSKWIRNGSFYLNSALSSPYTNIEDIKAQQELFETLDTDELSESHNLISQVEGLIENFRMLLYPAKLGHCYDGYRGHSIFDLYHEEFRDDHHYISQRDNEDDQEGINDYLEEKYGRKINLEEALLDGQNGLKQAKILLGLFFEKVSDLSSPIIDDLKKESDKFFGYYDYRFLFRKRSWKGKETCIHWDGYRESPEYIQELESFQINFKALSAMFEFLALVQREGWSKTSFDTSEPTQYTNAWHLRFDKHEHVPGSMTHNGDTKVFAGANASGKSFGGLKRDAYIRMAMQAFGYAPCESSNLQKPVGSILLLDRPDPNKIKERHFLNESRKNIGDPSAFMQEAKSIAEALKFLTKKGVVYMDEVFTTTSPEDQAALLLGIIEYVRERNGEVVLATHNEYVLQYLESPHSNFPTEMMHFGTKQGAGGHENTYQVEEGRADSDFLIVCKKYDAPPQLIRTAQDYLDGKWTLSDTNTKRTKEVVKYTSEERESLKGKSLSIMQLFPNADMDSILKFYSQDDDIQSWVSFDRSNIHGLFGGNNNLGDSHYSNMFDEIMSDSRHYSLIVKLLLHTHSSSSQDTLERQKMFSQLQKVSKKKYINISPILDFLGSFDTSLMRLEEINQKDGINRYLSDYQDDQIHKELRSFNAIKQETKRSINLGNLGEIQDFIDLNTLLFPEKLVNVSELQKILDILKKISRYKSLDLSNAYDINGKQYNAIPLVALRHILKILPEEYIPKDTSVQREKRRRDMISSITDKVIETGQWKEEARPNDDELQKLLLGRHSSEELEPFFKNVIAENVSYQIIENIVRNFQLKVKKLRNSIPKMRWQDLAKNDNSKVQEIVKRNQLRGRDDAENQCEFEDLGTMRLEIGIQNPWSSIYSITEFPKALEKLRSQIGNIDSVYIQQSLNTFDDIAQTIQNGEFRYLQYTPVTENPQSNYSTLSRLGKGKKESDSWSFGGFHHDIDSKRSRKSTGQVRLEVLGLKAILYWSEVIKGLGFGKVRFSNKNEMTFDSLSHLNLLGNKGVPNDVRIGGEYGQVRTLTGPNGSGKTFHEQSIILGIMSAMSTGFTPAKSASLPLFDRVVYLERVLEDSNKGLSAGANEIQYWKEIFDDIEGADNPFVALDELFSTTSPKYQEACTVSALDFMKEQGCLGVFSTHNHNAIKALDNSGESFPPYYFEYGSAEDGNIKYDRNITKGHAPSEGIEVAKRMGLNERIIDSSRKYKKIISDG